MRESTVTRPIDEVNPPRAPRGRRSEQIVRGAASLFHDLGYRSVSIDQIGAAVGLTGPAVYRHFKGKYEILISAMKIQADTLYELRAEAETENSTPELQLQHFLTGVARVAIRDGTAALWKRERGNLKLADFNEIRCRFYEINQYVAEKLVKIDPAINPYKADLLGFAIISVLANTPTIKGKLSNERLARLQHAIVASIRGCQLPTFGPDAAPPPLPVPRQPSGRRERIIAVSIDLFNERGFYDVRIDDIATEADMSPATLYQHTAGKSEVLRVILERGAQGLMYVMADALSWTKDPEEALDAILSTHIRQVMGPHGAIMNILSRDLKHLSEEERASIRETQREYLAEWTRWINHFLPNSTPGEARSLALAAIGVITEIAQSKRYRGRPGLNEELRMIANAIVRPAGLTST